MIYLYYLGALLYRPFSAKAKAWIEGRNRNKKLLVSWKQLSEGRPLWMHCASTGEYEQGQPILRKLKEQIPTLNVVVTFFSSSGYEQVNDPEVIDLKLYLPLDTSRRAADFIAELQPCVAVFIKAEFWISHYMELHKQNIPLIHVAGIFLENSYLHKSIFRKGLNSIDYFFVQDEISLINLINQGYQNAMVGGDPRCERVISIKEQPYENPELASIRKPIIVYGSVWKEDLPLIETITKAELTYHHVIAPHDLSSINLSRFYLQFHQQENVTIIDSMGELKYLYRYATLAYIGGGFGDGIHNTLEAAVYYIPIIFGPKFHKFIEARTFVKEGIAKSVRNQKEMKEAFYTLLNQKEQIKMKLSRYFNTQSANSDLIVQKIKEVIDNA